MSDASVVRRSAVDVDRLQQKAQKAWDAVQAAERQEKRTAEQAAATRKEAAQRRLELGNILIEARKAWPKRGPKAKGWGEFLAGLGIGDDSALRYMKLAGYVDEISRTDGGVREIESVPTYAEAGIKCRKAKGKKPNLRVVQDDEKLTPDNKLVDFLEDADHAIHTASEYTGPVDAGLVAITKRVVGAWGRLLAKMEIQLSKQGEG